MRHMGIVAAVLAAGMAAGPEIYEVSYQAPEPDTKRRKRVAPTRVRSASGSIAQANRHTGQPHEHKREIARRLRQLAMRDAGRGEG